MSGPGKSAPAETALRQGSKWTCRRRGLANLLTMGHCAPAVMRTILDLREREEDWLVRLVAGLPGGVVSPWLRLDQPVLAAPLPGIETQEFRLGDEAAVLDAGGRKGRGNRAGDGARVRAGDHGAGRSVLQRAHRAPPVVAAAPAVPAAVPAISPAAAFTAATMFT